MCGLLLGPVHAAESWWKVFGEIKPGVFAGGNIDSDKKPDKNLKKLLTTTKFDEWETFEDDLVKLSYPKHKLLKLEVNGGKKGISVEGGVCTTVDNSFQRAYVLKAGPFTYGVFLVAKADWLDDGICLCGPMVHHVYRMKDGCLVRFSLLPGGAVKKAQLLGDKLRLMSFEWTHLACQREVYEEMVERMTLKIQHPWTEERFQEEVSKRYGMAGRCGWLHPGMTLAAANKIMESEAKETEGIHRWTALQNDYPCVLKAEFKDGLLVRFTDEGGQRTGEEAVKGTFNWAKDRVERFSEAKQAAESKNDNSDPATTKEEKPPLPTPVEIAEVEETMLALADTQPKDQWWAVVDLMVEWVRSGWERDPHFVAAIIGVIVDRGTGTSGELDVLEKCGYADTRQWIEQKLTAMLAETPSTEGPATVFNNPVIRRANDGAEMLDHLALLDQAAAENHARALFKTREPAWTLAVLTGMDSFEGCPIPPQELLAEGLRRAKEAHSSEMVEAVLRLVSSCVDHLPHPEEIIQLIAELPKAKADSEWLNEEKAKAEAIKSLKALRKK